jgi:hypothetical protein
MRAFALLLVLLAAACGEIPQPFRHEGLDARLMPAASRGVVVRPMDDSAKSAAIAQLIVKKLVEGEIPAALHEAVPGAWQVVADRSDAPGLIVLRWRLLRADLGDLDVLEQRIPAPAWAKATPKMLDRVAREVAEKLAAPLHGELPAEVVQVIRVRILPLAGLPGDGNTALAVAMQRTLERMGMRLVDKDAEADFRIQGEVGLSPAADGQELLVAAWSVINPAGEVVGTANQQGPVPKGRLSGPWGSLAGDIAGGGAAGIAQIMRGASEQ